MGPTPPWSAARSSASAPTSSPRSTSRPGASPAAPRARRALAAPGLAERLALVAQRASRRPPTTGSRSAQRVEREAELDRLDGAVDDHRRRDRLGAGRADRLDRLDQRRAGGQDVVDEDDALVGARPASRGAARGRRAPSARRRRRARYVQPRAGAPSRRPAARRRWSARPPGSGRIGARARPAGGRSRPPARVLQDGELLEVAVRVAAALQQEVAVAAGRRRRRRAPRPMARSARTWTRPSVIRRPRVKSTAG